MLNAKLFVRVFKSLPAVSAAYFQQKKTIYKGVSLLYSAEVFCPYNYFSSNDWDELGEAYVSNVTVRTDFLSLTLKSMGMMVVIFPPYCCTVMGTACEVA